MRRIPEDVLNFFRKEGSRGGKLGSSRLTPAERRARALKASKAAAAARTARKKAKG